VLDKRGMPVPKSDIVASNMRRMPTRGTKPEVALLQALQIRNFRVETDRTDLPGRPDLVLPVRRVAVFVNGCFWHGCPKHFVVPKNNRGWWIEKIDGNRRRDRRKATHLRRLGWLVVTVWEHEDPSRAAQRIQKHSLRRSVKRHS